MSPHTVRAYDSDLSQFIAHAAAEAGVGPSGLDPAQLDREAIRSFLAELHRQGQSRATAARKLAAVRTFLRYLRRENIIANDPGGLVATPRRDVRMPAHLSENEMTELIAAASDATPLGRRDRAILELFYASGLRLSELTSLDLDDVSLSAKMVRVVGKGGKQRIVPFNSATVSAIRAYLKDRESIVRERPGEAPRSRPVRGARHQTDGKRGDPLFVNYRGGRLTVRSVDRLVRRYVASVSQRLGISPHAPAGRGPPCHSGDAGPRAAEHHTTLYARQCGAPPGGVSEIAPAGSQPREQCQDAAAIGIARRPRGNSIARVLIL